MTDGVTDPKISVVIATHNRIDLLPATLGSVRAQTYPNVEIVVVDDASADGTPDFMAQQTDITYVRSDENIERSRARNTGIERASGEYVLVLDDDDLLVPHALETLARALIADPGAVAAVAAYVKFDGHGNEARGAEHPRRRHRREIWRDFLLGWFAHHGRTLFRRSVLLEVGGYGIDPPHEDRELWLKVARRGPVIVLPDALMWYRLHAGMSKDDPWSTKEAVFRAHADTLPQGHREVAHRYIDSAAHLDRAHRAYDADRYGEALTSARAAVRAAPDVLSSFMGRGLIKDIVKATTGTVLRPAGVARIRSGLRAGRRMLRRDPYSAKQAARQARGDQEISG